MHRKTWSLILAVKKVGTTLPDGLAKLAPEKPFTAKQADAILELQLHRLTKLSMDEIIE